LPEVGWRRLRAHVAEAHRAGLRFNYTLNATTLANREWSILGQRALARLVERLAEAGVDTVTVAIPYLLEYVRRRAPGIEVAVSTQALVATPERARRWADLGAGAITLSVLDVNRDFARLRAIRAAVPVRLQLIANLLCLAACPASTYHSALNAHASQTGMSPFVVDACVVDCNLRRLADPTELIRAGWIRPEDQRHYAEVGIDRLKFVDRGMRTEVIAGIVRAYSAERSPADLMDLFPSPDKSLMYGRPRLVHLARHLLRPLRANPLRMRALRALAEPRAVRIDSAALGDFLAFFREGRCDPADCSACGYCAAVARRAVHADEAWRRRATERHRSALDDILTGRLFRYWP
jgi:collagenase-like PrtC family protease